MGNRTAVIRNLGHSLYVVQKASKRYPNISAIHPAYLLCPRSLAVFFTKSHPYRKRLPLSYRNYPLTGIDPLTARFQVLVLETKGD